jgi:transposase
MEGMVSYTQAAMERAMKVQEVILRAMAKKITWWQAAEIIGISDRQMRRWHERYEEFGFRGLFDQRRGKPSPKKVPLAVVEKVLGLYREKYFDLNVRHFHEKLQAEHQVEISYSWVKGLLQGAGMVAKGRKRGMHRQQRPRRPLPGMLLHIDGSEHRWFQDERWYDLLVILDDANSEIYYAQLVEEEATVTVLAGLKEVVERKGVFCALYSDRGSHFWLTPKAGEAVDQQRLTQVGRAMRELGVRMIPAYSPQARGRSERSFGTWQGRLPQELRLHGIGTVEAANAFLREHYIGEFNRRFQVASAQPGSAFMPCRRQDLQRIFSLQFERTVNRDKHGQLSEPEVADRTGALAGHAGGMHRDRAPTPGWNLEPQLWAARLRSLRRARRSDPRPKTGGRQGRGKDAGWKSPKADFPTPLGNPAKCAGFPLSHRLGCCGRLTKTGHFTCYEKRTF